MDLSRLMQQAQQMQRELGKIEDELNSTIYEGNNGGKNGVTIRINGTYAVEEVIVGEDLLDKENKEMLQDMIMIAMNDAVTKAAEDRESKMGSVTQGVRIPGM
ncbi:MAG: YbaB/EbfC family nucleoid-associated protein [Solobacterium sp.]|nr:YbaB/EbfC family nucleoid-associated protein [Erysipelotrichaceae bacterium]MBQ9153343.1 YbaB/EbfC family nucleoid-associated protein [Solobacterium sp.]